MSIFAVIFPRFDFWTWLILVLCSLFFLASSIRSLINFSNYMRTRNFFNSALNIETVSIVFFFFFFTNKKFNFVNLVNRIVILLDFLKLDYSSVLSTTKLPAEHYYAL